MSNKIMPTIKDMHGTFDMSDAVAVINKNQWEQLCKLATYNRELQAWIFSILGNDECFTGGNHEQ